MIITRNSNFVAEAAVEPDELTLDQMLSDPIVRLVMQRDGVSEAHLRAVIAEAARRRLANA